MRLLYKDQESQVLTLLIFHLTVGTNINETKPHYGDRKICLAVICIKYYNYMISKKYDGVERLLLCNADHQNFTQRYVVKRQ